MKLLFVSDIHWNTTSSSIQKRGTQFSVRLEHLIDSLNWVNKLAETEGCDRVICAGDFFDKARIIDEEATALTKIEWNKLLWYLLCGNHESSVNDLRFNMLKLLKTDKHIVVDTVQVINLDTVDILFLPYMVESDRKPLVEYIDIMREKLTGKPLVIVSHNDIAGIKYANGIESKVGFSIDEIQKNCALFLNGHLHNQTKPAENILNLGSFSAHNFSNDSLNYEYGVWTLDTQTMELKFFENPYGFNFYSFEIWKPADFKKLSKIKPNSAVKIKCTETLVPALKDELEKYSDKILEKTITQVLVDDVEREEYNPQPESKLDYLSKLAELCRATIPESTILEEELSIICK